MKTVCSPASEAEFSIISSLLEQSHIPFHASNRYQQNFFVLGQIGTGFNPLVGPIKIQVLEKDYNQAKLIIEDYYLKNISSQIPANSALLQKGTYKKYIALTIILSVVLPGFGIFPFIKALKLKYKMQSKINITFIDLLALFFVLASLFVLFIMIKNGIRHIPF